MSNNNQVRIRRIGKKGWEVREVDMDTNFGMRIGRSKTLLRAAGIANHYMEENLVVRGVSIERPKKRVK